MRQSDLIAKQLLAAKNRFVWKKAKVAGLKKRVQDVNPLNKIPELKMMMDIRILQKAKGDLRRQAVSDLMKMSQVKSAGLRAVKSNTFCGACGAKLPAGNGFCGECGTRVT